MRINLIFRELFQTGMDSNHESYSTMHVNFFFTTFIFYDFNENPLQTTGLDTQAHQRVSDGHLIYVNEKQYIYINLH